MNTPHETYKQSVEEFEGRFGHFWSVGTVMGGEANSPINWSIVDKESVKHFHKTTFLTLLRNEVERLERMESPYRPNDSEYYNDKHRECGWQSFKQKQIDHYKSQIALIEKDV